MSAEPPTVTTKGRLLIADDEPHFRDAMEQLLRLEGYECDSAPNAQTCHELLGQKRYDVLIADIRMPGNVELELLEQIQDSIYPSSWLRVTRPYPRRFARSNCPWWPI